VNQERVVTRTTEISLPYGTEILKIEVPSDNLLAIASPGEVVPQAGLETQVRQALREPVEAEPFSTLLRGGEHLLLLVDDVTRPTPVDRILPVLLEELDVERKRVEVTILVALGTHRKMTPEEIDSKIGPEIVAAYPVLNHEWDDESALLDLGTTANGTPIMVNRLIQEADVCFGIGNIVTHNLAGWSGGGKIVQPGICGKETTYGTHLLAARCPSSNLGKLVNPVRAEIERVARQTNFKGIVNTVLDRHGAVAHVVAGQSQAAHRRGVELARPIWEVPVPALGDIVLVSSHSADIDFWQANKGLYAAEQIVKRGGEIILVTPCPEGLSSQSEHVETLEALQGIPSRELYRETQRLGIEDYAALTVSNIAACCQELGWVTVVSDGLTEHDVGVLGFDRAASVEEALARALERQGSDASIVVLTHGGETLPVLEAEAG
jgi:nickel-dependent lactate racemase